MSEALLGPAPRSLRRRLLLWISLASFLIYAIAAALSYNQARHEVQEMMDAQMVVAARLLLVQAQGDAQHLAGLSERMAELRGSQARRKEMALEFRILRQDGTLLARSPHAPAPEKSAVDSPLGYTTIDHDGQAWRSLMLETADGKYRIQVAQSIRLRNKEALEIARKTVSPLGILLPMLIALIFFSIRRGLKPLDDLATDVSNRSPENLSPILPAVPLVETRPLVSALNRLLGRLNSTLENERRFTADAAHELRTPLAALKVHAQVAQSAQSARDPRQSQESIAKVIAGADRATHLVEQLLRLARLDPLTRLENPQTVDLVQLLRNAAEDAMPVAAKHGQNLIMNCPDEPLFVAGDHELLAAALRNLVDNAMRYSPQGTSVTLCARLEHGEPCLVVMDEGPGVAHDELARLVERFYRGRDNLAEGSGLGLAIVRRIAELHGARLEVENRPEGGFVARIRCRKMEMP